MNEKLFGVNFSPEEISIDETGKVIINNPNLAKAIKSSSATNTDVTARRRREVNINCYGCPGDSTPY
ncbi:hypothetical protein [Brevibacillus laterosporus]|uniref:hypothetical protein n=1 Tax=Brevibacillus laterosporus TaxID=1465 RepID=UPI0026508ED4|nr:hypothetical protein [Brevibacillus laterosporus]MDN9011551.1 hypothetical protein [Brevibacillus laterosporus]MDO0942816.1 hypothetical protein [Brevibacillus laterosporus]